MKCYSYNLVKISPPLPFLICLKYSLSYLFLEVPKSSRLSLLKKSTYQKTPPPYMLVIFFDLGKDMTTMISCILGFTTNEYIDEIIFAYMSIFIPGQPPAVKFDYAKFIADKMHDQFMRLENERVFKYSSVLYHLFLYYQTDKFPFSVQKLDTKGNPRSAIFWTSLFHMYCYSHYPYTDFIDLFLHPVTTMLLGSLPLRINAYIKRVLQLSKQYKVGDWYLYQNHTEIKIYECELPPYKLPRYLPM